ncbi:MAG: efflux RND transporter periplasmic adaptor subunit [Verrucomicrobiota bacterium]|nr:efflux RND transporter periplasmic adaptor subunit [Limisphaera sp.]MDW8381383.1 efflux RND transporter periplasmic adaptor subunit [Verrucomicrobiota bacterium]
MGLESRSWRWIWAVAAAGCLVGLAWVVWWRHRVPIYEVQATPVVRRDLTEVVVANGRIQPVVQVKISAEVSGEIVELLVKEGQTVQQGQLVARIKPDVYEANRRSAEASYRAAVSARDQASANARKAELEYERHAQLHRAKLISESMFEEYRTALEVAQAQLRHADHQVEVARAALARAEEELAKTTIYAPIHGTVSRLSVERGERVAGNTLMAGTEIMTIADLNNMEARVEVGETDVVWLRPGQKARLEVDAFRDRKFTGLVTEIANSSRNLNQPLGSQEATKFEVRIRIQEKEAFRPGMSVTAEIETRYRTNVLAVPLASVTTRLAGTDRADRDRRDTSTEAVGNDAAWFANKPAARREREPAKSAHVVFVVEGDQVRMVPVKLGISDAEYWEVEEGLKEGQLVVSGGYKVIHQDLVDGARVRMAAIAGHNRKESG